MIRQTLERQAERCIKFGSNLDIFTTETSDSHTSKDDLESKEEYISKQQSSLSLDDVHKRSHFLVSQKICLLM